MAEGGREVYTMPQVKLSLTRQEMGAQLHRAGGLEPSSVLVIRTEGASQAACGL